MLLEGLTSLVIAWERGEQMGYVRYCSPVRGWIKTAARALSTYSVDTIDSFSDVWLFLVLEWEGGLGSRAELSIHTCTGIVNY